MFDDLALPIVPWGTLRLKFGFSSLGDHNTSSYSVKVTPTCGLFDTNLFTLVSLFLSSTHLISVGAVLLSG